MMELLLNEWKRSRKRVQNMGLTGIRVGLLDYKNWFGLMWGQCGDVRSLGLLHNLEPSGRQA